MRKMLISALLLTTALAGAAFYSRCGRPLQEAGGQVRVGRDRQRPEPVHARHGGTVQARRRELRLGGQRDGRRSVPSVKGTLQEDGARCVWDGNDSGGDQCDPHKAK